MKNLIAATIIGSVVSLYTTFVIQHLWNWFATSAFHVSEISFWAMYGPRWKTAYIILEACIPDAKKEEVETQLKQQMEVRIWADAGLQAFGKVVGTTFALVLGLVVHLFLA
jgi:hypothetical protein